MEEPNHEGVIALADRCIEKAQQMARDCLGDLYRGIMLGSVYDLREAKHIILRHGQTKPENWVNEGRPMCLCCFKQYPCPDYMAATTIIGNWAQSWKLSWGEALGVTEVTNAEH